MATERIGREKTLELMGFRVTIGTTNYKEPNTIYLEFKFFLTPTVECNGYKRNFMSFTEDVEKAVGDFGERCGIFMKKTIVVVESAYTQMRVNKPSYVFIQAVLRQNSKQLIPYDKMVECVEKNLGYLSSDVFHLLPENGFKLYNKGK